MATLKQGVTATPKAKLSIETIGALKVAGSLDKTIKGNIARIIAAGTKQRELCFITLQQIIDNGNTTRHYDRLPELMSAIQSNALLTKDLKAFYAGKVPHTVVVKNGIYSLSKRDESLLADSIELELKALNKADKTAETSAKLKANNELKKEKIEKFDVIQQDLFKANELNLNLVNEKTSLLTELKALQAAPSKKAKDLQKEVESLKAELNQANDYIQTLIAELKGYAGKDCLLPAKNIAA